MIYLQNIRLDSNDVDEDIKMGALKRAQSEGKLLQMDPQYFVRRTRVAITLGKPDEHGQPTIATAEVIWTSS